MEKKGEVNVPRYIDDPYYRYVMPKMNIKIEGRGKMIKSIIVNLNEIAEALERPAEYIIKFIGFELSTQVDIKKYTIAGERNTEELYKALDGFIEIYILCKNCKNPETEMSYGSADGKGKERIILSCRACGGKTIVSEEHKFHDFLVKKEVAKGGPKKSKKSDDPVDSLRSFWIEKPNETDIIAQVESIQKEQKWSDDHKLRVVFLSLFDKNPSHNFDENLDIIKLFVNSPKSQETLLYCFDHLSTMDKSTISQFPSILQKLYEKKIVFPQQIWNWYNKPHSKIDNKISQNVRNNVREIMKDIPK